MHPGVWVVSELVPKDPMPSSLVPVQPPSLQFIHPSSSRTPPKVFIAQLCPTLSNLMDCSPLGSSVNGIL